jgi:hypothetical protein
MIDWDWEEGDFKISEMRDIEQEGCLMIRFEEMQ